MSDRAGFFAGLTEILTVMCAYYTVARFMLLGEIWSVPLRWVLLCSACAAVFFALLLHRPRSVPLLTGVTGALALVTLAVFLLASSTPAGFGYVLVMCVGAGIGVGVSLYTCLHRPQILRHLMHLEAQFLVLLVLLLIREASRVDAETLALSIAVLLLDAAAAVGLRMSDGAPEDGGRALLASLIALGAAAGITGLIALLATVFSRSGALTDRFLRAVGTALAKLGALIERFFSWIVELFYREEVYDAAEQLEGTVISASGEAEEVMVKLPVNTTVLGLILALLVIAAAVRVAFVLRKKRVSRALGTTTAGGTTMRRTRNRAPSLRRRLLARLDFLRTAFMNRNTPGGLLLCLERAGRRAKTPRDTGESMRAFVRRMDPGGGLDELADALDSEYYGCSGHGLSEDRCRELRRIIRKAVRHD